MSQLNVDEIRASDGTTTTEVSIPSWVPKGAIAWVKFDGYTGAIADSYNVVSIIKNATGNYTVNFSVTMADTNYAITSACFSTATRQVTFNDNFTTSVSVLTWATTGVLTDVTTSIAILSSTATT